MPKTLTLSRMQPEKNTPLMEQYFSIKAQFPDTLLFFQVGDFFELFFDDAKRAAQHLAIALTKRGKNKGEDIPLCGIPVHALDHYLTKLIKGGFRVALCEQLSKPQPGTVVQRGVTKVFTPATLTDASMLEEKSASYLLSLYPGSNGWGLVFGELLTAQLFATTVPVDATRQLEAELIRFFPDEIVISHTTATSTAATHCKKLGYYTCVVHPLDTTSSEAWVSTTFAGQGHYLTTAQPIKNSLETLFWYLKRHQEQALAQFKNIHFYQPDDYLILDAATQKNLEIIQNTRDGSVRNTLFSVLDHAQTAMGSRTIKKWLQRLLVQKSAITQRLDAVEQIKTNVQLQQQLQEALKGVADVERMVGRIALKRAQVQDYLALKDTLQQVPTIKALLSSLQAGLAQLLNERMHALEPLQQLIDASINDDPEHEHLIKTGFDHNLDHIYYLLKDGKQAFLNLEQQECNRTGITSLKVGYNQVTGYYIEITNANSSRIPDDFTHLQTLANRKRFTTPALKALEQDFFKAHTQREALEAEVFERVKREVEQYLQPLRQLAQSLAYLDALFGLAKAAYEYQFTRPQFNDSRTIAITAGKHPVVELNMQGHFQPNDLLLNDDQSTLIITGPNMGGKSTYLRQNALMCIMAQCGSFVPAGKADLFILDRVFTRIGSGDNVAEGKSTFLVEMEETATICTQATANSLVILDEVGRGTSTYDGIALAQAILEHIHTKLKARCLFATHYHELTQLEATQPGIANFHAACKRVADGIVFLHKIIRGSTEGSFGLNVARLAQVPEPIVVRAQEILQGLGVVPAQEHAVNPAPAASNPEPPAHVAVINELHNLDCSNITPKQALDVLWKLVESIKT